MKKNPPAPLPSTRTVILRGRELTMRALDAGEQLAMLRDMARLSMPEITEAEVMGLSILQLQALADIALELTQSQITEAAGLAPVTVRTLKLHS